MTGLRAVVLGLLAVLAAAVVVQGLAVRVPSTLSLDYVEGFDQLDAERVAQGGALYGDPSEPPFTIHVYTPLYTFLVSLALRAGTEGFAAGRILGAAAVLGTAILVIVSARRRSGWIAWAVAALYLTTPLVGTWAALGRPDALAVFFSACGIVLVDRYWKSRAVYAAIPLFGLALLTKQSVAMGLLASFLYLLARAPRRALGLAVLTCGAGLAVVAALEWASDGWFLFHTVTANMAPYSFAKVLELQRQFFALHWPELAVALFVLVAWFRERKGSLYVLWFGCSAVATLSLGKSGSDTNHLLEALAATAFLIANAWPLQSLARSPAWVRGLAPVALVLMGVLALFNYGIQSRQNTWIEPAESRVAEITDRLSGVPGPVISDDATILRRLRKPLLFRPFAMTQLAYAGKWNDARVIDLLEDREVGLVIFEALPGHSPNRARYTAGMRDALTRNYRRVGSYQTQRPYEIYAPRGGEPPPLPKEAQGRESSASEGG